MMVKECYGCRTDFLPGDALVPVAGQTTEDVGAFVRWAHAEQECLILAHDRIEEETYGG